MDWNKMMMMMMMSEMMKGVTADTPSQKDVNIDSVLSQSVGMSAISQQLNMLSQQLSQLKTQEKDPIKEEPDIMTKLDNIIEEVRGMPLYRTGTDEVQKEEADIIDLFDTTGGGED